MTAVGVDIEHVGDLEQARRRLGDAGHVRRAVASVLDESADIAKHSAQIFAPGRIKTTIDRTGVRIQPSGSLEVGVGARPLRTGGSAGTLHEGQEDAPLFVHEGTGLFGRYHRLIRPRHRRYMRFTGRTGLVYAKTVRGQRAQPFVREAYDELLAFIPQRLDLMVRRIFDTDL